jgi:predicted dehydrogenase
MTRLRIGVPGAACITPMALIRPARSVPDAAVTAVAARDHGRAAAFAAKHGIPVVHRSYADLVADPDVDAVYIPLLLGLSGRVVGEAGELRIFNYIAPHVHNRLTVTVDGRSRQERVPGEPTYTYQLRAFADAVLHGGPVLTPASDAVLTMSLIDDAYRAAGLSPRGSQVE